MSQTPVIGETQSNAETALRYFGGACGAQNKGRVVRLGVVNLLDGSARIPYPPRGLEHVPIRQLQPSRREREDGFGCRDGWKAYGNVCRSAGMKAPAAQIGAMI
jgi:hypothetical protein